MVQTLQPVQHSQLEGLEQQPLRLSQGLLRAAHLKVLVEIVKEVIRIKRERTVQHVNGKYAEE